MGWLIDMLRRAEAGEPPIPDAPAFDYAAYDAFMDPDRPGLLPFQRRIRLLCLEGYEIGEGGQAWRVPKYRQRPNP